jgi:23S rRNA (cytidine1920-2'-O)/16S rRNA (cytidine1409-2'-O)-methyltransferase
MRLDRYLVEHLGVESRARARALIEGGHVSVDGETCAKPARAVAPGNTVSLVEGAMPWVSRGALKLLHALDAFDLDPSGAVAWDLGASTGGFTEVLLSRGAARVVAIDVGHGQLHPRVAADPRVLALESVNVRALPTGLPSDAPRPDWLTADLSFIALVKALPAALSLAAPGARLVALVKPQFELSPAEIGRGGLVRDGAARRKALDTVIDFLGSAGWAVTHHDDSPIAGGDGNREYLVSATRRS